MKVSDIRLGHSPLTDKIYAGRLNKDGAKWLEKTDVTNDFIHAAIGRWSGYKEKITGPDGEMYEFNVNKIESEQGER